jgi:drug/metabolite transporter (DMT)-like permease
MKRLWGHVWGRGSALPYALLAAFLFSLMALCAKWAHEQSSNNAMVVFFRNSVSLLILTPLLLRNGVAAFKTERLGGHLWRAGFGLLGMYTLFYATAHLRLAEALLLNNAAPLFIPWLAWWLLKEKPSVWILPASVLGLVGMVLVLKPSPLGLSFDALIGAASGVFAAAAMVSLRRITNTEPPLRVVFYFALIGCGVSSLPLFVWWQTPSLWALLFLVLTGVFATFGQLALTKAYAQAPAAQVSILGYSAVLFTGGLDYLFWAKVPDRWSVVGAVLVVLACGLSQQKKR